jgi:hypothetical protein
MSAWLLIKPQEPLSVCIEATVYTQVELPPLISS